MQKVKLGNVKYIGVDIVPDIIKDNEQYENKNRSFSQLDITRNELPLADLILVRDCLVHFPHEEIINFIYNILIRMVIKSHHKIMELLTF